MTGRAVGGHVGTTGHAVGGHAATTGRAVHAHGKSVSGIIHRHVQVASSQTHYFQDCVSTVLIKTPRARSRRRCATVFNCGWLLRFGLIIYLSVVLNEDIVYCTGYRSDCLIVFALCQAVRCVLYTKNEWAVS